MTASDTKPRTRLGAFRERVRALPGGRIAWRIAVTVVGVAVIAVGIVLLPLPGPGWLVIFAGLGMLATEYEWAARLLQWVRRQVRAGRAGRRAQPAVAAHRRRAGLAARPRRRGRRRVAGHLTRGRGLYSWHAAQAPAAAVPGD